LKIEGQGGRRSAKDDLVRSKHRGSKGGELKAKDRPLFPMREPDCHARTRIRAEGKFNPGGKGGNALHRRQRFENKG